MTRRRPTRTTTPKPAIDPKLAAAWNRRLAAEGLTVNRGQAPTRRRRAPSPR